MSAIITTHNTELTQKVIDMIKTCYDPEIPVDIWELGLIYEIDLDQEGRISLVGLGLQIEIGIECPFGLRLEHTRMLDHSILL